MPISHICKTQQLFDERTETWFDLYKAPSINGTTASAYVPRAERSARFVRRQLLNRGAVGGTILSDAAIASAIESDAPIVHRAGGTGWRNEYSTFVCPCHVVGENHGAKLLPPAHPMVSDGRLTSRGNLVGWQRLASIANHSSTMIVALSAAFAAPLISILHRPSFALQLFGPSRCGKSTAQLLASSVLGFGSEEDLPTFNATRAGLLAMAATFGDLLLSINEAGTANGSSSTVSDILRGATYAFTSGRDTARHPSWYDANGGAASTYRLICLVSSEVSPDAWAARDAQERDDGERARLIGVPVPLSASNTIFDRAPNMDEAKLQEWEKDQFEAIRSGLAGQRGFAFKRYLEAFIEGGEDIREKAAVLASRFESKVGRHAKSAVARDIVAKFGVVYAGGVLASDLDILPVKAIPIFNATRKACLAALADLPDHKADLISDLAKLREKPSSGSISMRESLTPRTTRMLHRADGVSYGKEDGREYVIRATSFTDTFATPLRVRRVLDWLDSEGLLAHSREPTARRSNAWAQTQVTWPNGTRVRSIVIYIPNSISDLIP